MTEAEVLKIIVAAHAAGEKANLRGANLHGADLRGANLGGANLGGVNLSDANLTGADLGGADLGGANLTGADLGGANLSDANLNRANLRGANLHGANLSDINLGDAILIDTILDPTNEIPALSDAEILAAGLEIVGDRVYGYRTARSTHCGNTDYTVRDEPYVAPCFSTAANKCHPGRYMASKQWMDDNVQDYSADLVRCYCLRSELIHVGDKWRCKRLWIVA